MRVGFLLLFLIICSVAEGSRYYVAPQGNDNDSGTINQPFATWQKGFTVAKAGDTVFIRGGTYYPSGTLDYKFYCGVAQRNHNGTSSNPIKIWAYPGETPILDCRNMAQSASHIGIAFENCSFWHLKGLTITRADQTIGFGAAGIRIFSGNNIILENITSHHNGGSGIQVLENSEGNLLLNCDAYCNYDPYSTIAGEHADGIEIADIRERNGNERVNTMISCRSWENGDDGFDHFRCEGILVFDSCWSWHNGYVPGTETAAGNGDGFKLGITSGTPEKVTQRKVTNCISYNNRTRGFSQNGANVMMEFYNNIAYDNVNHGYLFYTYNVADKLKNNISYKNGANIFSQSNQIIENNSWQNGIIVSDADFMSLEGAQLTLPRKADGSLPDIDFMHLVPGSDLIDAGADVGHPYYGDAPDIGVFEITEGAFHLNQLPIVSISIPTKADSYLSPATITVNAEASDPDGTITMLELYNGKNKIGKSLEAPYSFTMKDLPVGSYSLKAIAFDNLKASSSSATLEFKVISNFENPESFKLYPNPNNGYFTVDFTSLIETEIFTVTVFDLIGNPVYQVKLPKEEYTRQFDLSHLNNGTYVMVVSAEQILLTQKFIKG